MMKAAIPISIVYLNYKQRRMINMHIYEKEIYSHEIPLYKREVMGVIEDFCHVPSDEIAGDIPGYFLSDSENKVNIIHRSDLPKFDAESLIIIKPEGELIGPDYFGYVEIKEIIEQVEIPIHIRIVSYQEKLNMFWMRLAEKIINKIHEKLPNFASELDFNNPSKSSANKPLRPDTQINYEDRYRVIIKTRSRYRKLYKNREITQVLSQEPTIQDYIDAISAELKCKPLSQKTVERVIKWGDSRRVKKK